MHACGFVLRRTAAYCTVLCSTGLCSVRSARMRNSSPARAPPRRSAAMPMPMPMPMWSAAAHGRAEYVATQAGAKMVATVKAEVKASIKEETDRRKSVISGAARR
jgi:hypothetical protein